MIILTEGLTIQFQASHNARDEKTVLFNKKKVSYEVTVYYEDRSGNTMASSTTIHTPEALEGNTAKVVIYPVEVEDAKPISDTQKIRVSADTEFTFLYYVLTSYTITVNHIYSGVAIASATTIEVEAYEEETVSVTIEPEEIEGYTASPVTIRVSGDCEYDLEYDLGCPLYEFVDLDLPSGTLWATKNVGACNPEDYGDYYAWGEITTKSAFTEDNYRFYDANNEEITKYNDNDELTVLENSDDVAYLEVGNNSHIPTPYQWSELFEYTDKELITINGNTCVKFTPQVYEEEERGLKGGESLRSGDDVPFIIIPLAGYKDNDKEAGKVGEEDFGALWTNDLVSTFSAGVGLLILDGSNLECEIDKAPRTFGFPVRPVIGEGPQPQPAL